jgi:hypothetical protein
MFYWEAVGIAICYGLDGPGFEWRWGQEIFLFSKTSRPVLGTTQQISGEISGRGVKLTFPLHLVLTLRISRTLRLVPYMPSWRWQVKFSFSRLTGIHSYCRTYTPRIPGRKTLRTACVNNEILRILSTQYVCVFCKLFTINTGNTNNTSRPVFVKTTLQCKSWIFQYNSHTFHT